jgi:L,D-peptidoglycan transpeptidase YkuD (ErfK/YbiS/YcfS/YnhG family)|tara:strand:- start:7591 stop:8094 length:504 start_codon:yes stop_codon:yes gene_type:complete
MNIHVYPSGKLVVGKHEFCCAIGFGGVRTDKSEGDGATPVGCFVVRRVLYRPDRLDRPATRLPTSAIRPTDGWCDDPTASEYNCQIRIPFHAGHEELWREDVLYNIVVVLGYNDQPPIPDLGSAIFLHVAGSNYAATEGCIAVAQKDLVTVLSSCELYDNVCVMPPN